MPASELRSQFLFEMTIRFGDAPRLEVGDGGRGDRQVAPAAGGTFEGPHLRGEILPPLPDYLVHRADGITEHDIRAVLRTEDGALIYMEYPGIGHRNSLGPLGELAEGELYFRVTPRFETAAEQYRWLNGVVAVGVFEGFREGAIHWRIYGIR